jgi:hypothetical protein
MKKFYTLIVILLLSFSNSFAQSYSQYFDGADTLSSNSIVIEIDTSQRNIWQIGKPQKAIFDSAATLPNAIVTDTINYYPSNNISRFIAKVNLTVWGNGIFALQWQQKLDLDTNYDGGIIEYSTDAGQTWFNVMNNPYVYNFYGWPPNSLDTLPNGEFAFSGTDSVWRDVWLCFDMSWLQQFSLYDTAFFRFTLKSDSTNNNKEGWLIDNMVAHITFIHTIQETEQNNYINVFPNPSGNIVNIQVQKIVDFHIIEKMELIDQLGRTIEHWENIPTKFWFSVQKYDPGSYFLKIKTNLKSETVPLIISKH